MILKYVSPDTFIPPPPPLAHNYRVNNTNKREKIIGIPLKHSQGDASYKKVKQTILLGEE